MTSQIDKLFGSHTRVQVLTKLITNSNRSFYIRELSRDLELTFSVVYKEIENLKKLGLVTEERKGRLRLFRINKESIIYDDLRKLLLKTAALGQVLKNTIPKINDTKYTLIYGSFARGRELEISDIDLLVIGNIQEEELMKGIREVEKKLGRDISYILWSEKEFKERVKAKHHLLTEIAGNPAIELVGDVDEFRKTVEG